MKTVKKLAISTIVAATLSITTLQARAQSIPEPGVILYGSVTNLSGNQPLISGNVVWQISGGSPVESATVSASVVSVNGQFFYIARVPFETRAVSGGVTFTKSPNTLALAPSPVNYTRVPTVNGTNATIAAPKLGSFTFGAADRGVIERVDLQVTLPGISDIDSDGDGMPDWAELFAGTDPHNANSVFKLSSDIQPMQDGLMITWSSVAGKTYSVSRSDNLGTPRDQRFSVLNGSVNSAGATTSYTDNTATNSGPYFYRIQVNQ